MIKRNKKGFTIVELVIVIAIVAILAAILIPTFSSVIDRANESADIQTVRQINVIIAAELIEKGDLTLDQVLELLEDYNFTADNLKPAGDNHKFMWDDDKNVIILVEDKDGDMTLIYPIEDGDEDAFAGKIEDETITEISSSTGGEPFDIVTAINNLENGSGTVKLTGPATISEPISIDGNVTIDLNGKTLTLGDAVAGDNVLTVMGSLTVQGGYILIEEPSATDDETVYMRSGVCVRGELTLNGVNITGNRVYNIDNYGTVFITNSEFFVNYGYGLTNSYGDATVSNSNFVANGEATQIYGLDGGISITNTNFSEGDDFTGYCENKAPIEAQGGDITMNGVTVTLGENTINKADPDVGPYSFFAGSSSEVIIDNDSEGNSSFNYIFSCVGDSTSITIYGGTFNDGTNDVPFDVNTTPSTIFIAAGYELTQGENCWIISKS